jgi:hypothetical protein
MPDVPLPYGSDPFTGSPDRLGAVREGVGLPDPGSQLTPWERQQTQRFDTGPVGRVANTVAQALETGAQFDMPVLGMIRSPYKASWVGGGRMGEYDPEFFNMVPDELKDESGKVLAAKDRLVPKEGVSFDFPAEAEPGVVYRGMSAGEFADFQKTGRIKSKGDYNIGSQAGLTYFTKDPHAAVSYADSFAPRKYKATFDKPAYVIAIKEPPADRIRHVPGVAGHEMGVTGEIPSSDVVGVYRGNVVSHDPGVIDRSGGGVAPSSRIIWEKLGLDSHGAADALPMDYASRMARAKMAGLAALAAGAGGAAAASGLYPTETPKSGPTPVAMLGVRG